MTNVVLTYFIKKRQSPIRSAFFLMNLSLVYFATFPAMFSASHVREKGGA